MAMQLLTLCECGRTACALQTFDEQTPNEVVYNYTARPLVNFVFKDRGRATVFA